MEKISIKITADTNEEAQVYLKGPNYRSALEETQNLFRNTLKYRELSEDQYKIVEELRDEFKNIFLEHVNDNDIY